MEFTLGINIVNRQGLHKIYEKNNCLFNFKISHSNCHPDSMEIFWVNIGFSLNSKEDTIPSCINNVFSDLFIQTRKEKILLVHLLMY